MLFATGYADRMFVERLDPEEEVLFKPFSETTLSETMQKLMRHRPPRRSVQQASVFRNDGDADVARANAIGRR